MCVEPSELTVEIEGAAAYSEDGVDLTLIRWMLSLTPLERLRYLIRHHRSILKLRAFAARA